MNQYIDLVIHQHMISTNHVKIVLALKDQIHDCCVDDAIIRLWLDIGISEYLRVFSVTLKGHTLFIRLILSNYEK